MLKKICLIVSIFGLCNQYSIADVCNPSVSLSKTTTKVAIPRKKLEKSLTLYHLASIGCLEQKIKRAPGIKKPCYPSTPYRNPNYRPLFWNPQAPYGFAK